ncbi:hypothetical protein BpHYR1_050027 [Brachionus plicatilis]|uniref:Uncharacterized protein n=1 Tax=Brachionus plicatilis TaxID=10195 RepID=A0A3M7S1B5_BRAPC|nr:hypothetical protein BpHYR1_050027 [Brachionus plicatilis]
MKWAFQNLNSKDFSTSDFTECSKDIKNLKYECCIRLKKFCFTADLILLKSYIKSYNLKLLLCIIIKLISFESYRSKKESFIILMSFKINFKMVLIEFNLLIFDFLNWPLFYSYLQGFKFIVVFNQLFYSDKSRIFIM